MARYLEQRLKMRHLRVVDAVEHHKSILRAAGALGVSQPSLTRSIREIEEIVGAVIFDRHSRGVEANALGLMLAREARHVLFSIRRVEDEFAAMSSGRQRRLAVGASPEIANGLMSRLVAKLWRETGVHVRLMEAEHATLQAGLLSGEIDLAVGSLQTTDVSGLEQSALYGDTLSMIVRAGHPLTFETHPKRGLSRYPAILVLCPPSLDTRAIARTNGISLAVAIETSALGSVEDMLMDGDFIALAPAMLLGGGLMRETLARLPVPVIACRWLVGVTQRRQSSNAAANLLIAEVRREVETMQALGFISKPDGSEPEIRPETKVVGVLSATLQ